VNQTSIPEDTELVASLIHAMASAIPHDVPGGYVMQALCALLKHGVEHAPPDCQEEYRATIVNLFSPHGGLN
jgi:hypothetical protein